MYSIYVHCTYMYYICHSTWSCCSIVMSLMHMYMYIHTYLVDGDGGKAGSVMGRREEDKKNGSGERREGRREGGRTESMDIYLT